MKSLGERKRLAAKYVSTLKKLYPNSEIALKYSNDWELLVAVILSAQCTDKMVNKVTKRLFKKYKTIKDYANAKQTEFEQDIKSTGFYKNKTANIIADAKIILEKYKGRMPDTMEEMLKLRGVARKSANIILHLVHGKTEGIAVDTHVKRLSKLLGLTDNSDPVKIEKDLMEVFPRKEWMDFCFRLIYYGREYCTARKHDHGDCPLSRLSF
ncbi:MAG: endonuclease III [Nanoarchaeota archaeon]|nr:MAG: endonuclease III [Nanoarchaeota archaeon]